MAPARRPFRLAAFIERESVFSWLMLTPPLLFLLAFLGYPFFYGVYLSFFHREVASVASFVGLSNFVTLSNDPIFWQAVRNTILFTAVATVLKASGGLAMALVMNQDFRFKNLTRALLLLPFIVPTVLSTIAWQWILDPAFSVINWALMATGLANPGPSWLGNPYLAMFSLIMVNTWRGLPFYAITLLAGLQTISPELYEAATIDGASRWQVFSKVLLPLVSPGILTVAIISGLNIWNEFLISSTFLQSHDQQTAVVRFYTLGGQYSSDWGEIMAAAIIIVAPAVAFFLLMQRRFIQGMAAGSVKG